MRWIAPAAASSSPPPVPHREPAVLPAAARRLHRHANCRDVKADDLGHGDGALRFCPHRKIQELYTARTGKKYWDDVSPIINPISYYRARGRLLDAGIIRYI